MDDSLKFDLGFGGVDTESVKKAWADNEAKIQESLSKISKLKIPIDGTDVVKLNENLAKTEKMLARISKMQVSATGGKITPYRAGQLDIQSQERMIVAQQKQQTELARTSAAEARAEIAKLRLKETQDKLSGATDRSTRSTSRNTEAFKAQKGVMNGMPQFLNAYISILGGMRLISNIREVTSEFELQRVALGAIIQDKAKADQLFAQVTQLAVQSPFQVKELITYTKELSAYRIETEHLFDTTKRLADISAGLGVDMGRLILAYGQVSAASVLRGQELRQFTEAGIPLVSLLADKFSALRGEMVSTGEVFQLISDRAVSFGMVKEIFEDMTNVGGTFYNMQKIQAETLAGSWSNLKDEIDLAMNAMGQENYGVMKGMINLTRDLARNWETVLNVLTDIGLAYGVYRLAIIATTKSTEYANAQLGIQKTLTIQQIIADGKLAAGKDRLAAIQMRLTATTAAEIAAAQGLINSIETTNAAYLKRQLIAGKVSKDQVIQLILTKQTTAAQRELFVQTNLLTAAEVKQALVESSLIKQRNILQIGVAKLTSSFKNLWSVISGNIWMALIAGLFLVAKKIYEVVTAAGKLQAELNKITVEGLREAGQLDARFKRLAGIVTDSTKSVKEQNEALSELQNTYRDIIPAHQLTIKGLEAMAGNYTAVTAAIYAKIKAQRDEKGLTAIEERAGAEVQSQYDDLLKNLQDYVKARQKQGHMLNVIDEDIIRGLSEFRRRVESGELSISGEKVDIFFGRKGVRTIAKEYTSLLEILEQSTSEKFDIMQLLGVTHFSGAAANMDELASALSKYRTELVKFKAESEQGFKPFTPKGGAMSAYEEFVKEGGERQTEFSKIIRAEGEDYVAFIDRQLAAKTAIYTSFLASIKGKEGEAKVFETIQKDISSMSFNPLQKGIKDTISEFAALKDIPTDSFKDLLKTSEESLETYGGRLLKSANETKTYVAQLESATFQLGTRTNEEELKTRRNRAELEALLIAEAGLKKDKKKKGATTTDPRISALKSEISLAETAYKRYEDLAKQVGKVKAEADVRGLYQGIFNDFKELKGAELPFTIADLNTIIQAGLDKSYIKGKDKLEIGVKIPDNNWKELSAEAKEKLAKLQSEIEDQQKSNDFFESILGLTGNRQLAADLTVGIYGAGFEDITGKIKEQLTAVFGDIDIRMQLGGDAIDYSGLIKKLELLPLESQKTAKKLIQDARNSSATIMSDLYKSLGDYTTYQYKRVEIARKAQRQLNDIEKMQAPKEEKEKLTKAVKKKEAKDYASLGYDEFKESELYTTMFENLDFVSTKVLGSVREQFEKVKASAAENLSPKELKELVQKMELIDTQLATRNPFNTLIESAKAYRDEIKKEPLDIRIQKFDTSAKVAATSKAEADDARATMLAQEEVVRLSEQKNGLSSSDAVMQRAILELYTETAEQAGQKADADQASMDANVASINVLNKFKKGMAEGLSGISDIAGMASAAIGSVQELGEALGFSDETQLALASVGQVLDGLSDVSAGIGDIISDKDVIGGALKIFTGLVDTIAGAFSAGYIKRIAEANREIERQAQLLKDLDKAYSKLQQQESKVLGEDFVKNQQEQVANLKAKEEAIRKQLEAEQSKGKKADKGAIAQFEEALKEATEAAAEAVQEMGRKITEAMLETDVTSMAKQMAKSWLDAYIAIGRQGAVTTDEMKQQWADMMKTMVANSLLARAVQAAFEPVFKDIDKVFADGRIPTTDEINAIVDKGFAAIDVLGVTLPELLKGLNLDKLGASADGLTGIAKNVAQASEDQITGLAAGINTQNAYFGQTVMLTTNIYALMQKWDAERATSNQGVTMQTLIGIQMTSLAHLKGIEANTGNTADSTKAILDELRSIIKPVGVSATKVVKTQLQ